MAGDTKLPRRSPNYIVGYDEHGPAYPDPPLYRCPTCGIEDRSRYLDCNHTMCPDGRDQARLQTLAEVYDPYQTPNRWQEAQPVSPWPAILSASITALIVTLFLFAFTNRAPAMDHGFDPSNPVVKWFEKLQRPDFKGSCCGAADAYPVERYWRNPDGTWTAVISDGSAKKFPDGKTRDFIPDGTEVIVEDRKVNKLEDDEDNLTDVSWIFMTVSDATVRTVFCFVRHPSGG